jgi:hypothetical protein
MFRVVSAGRSEPPTDAGPEHRRRGAPDSCRESPSYHQNPGSPGLFAGLVPITRLGPLGPLSTDEMRPGQVEVPDGEGRIIEVPIAHRPHSGRAAQHYRHAVVVPRPHLKWISFFLSLLPFSIDPCHRTIVYRWISYGKGTSNKSEWCQSPRNHRELATTRIALSPRSHLSELDRYLPHALETA